MFHECDGHDHRLETYAASDRRLLALVEAFNVRLLQAMDEGADLSEVTDALDPDPARYTWVDEGGGIVDQVLQDAGKVLADAPAIPQFRRLGSAGLPASLPAARPAVAVAPDGTLVTAWVEWEPKVGERVVAGVFDAGGRVVVAPEAISGPPGDCLRPSVVCDGDGTAWVFFGLRRAAGVEVRCSRVVDGRWLEPEPVSTTPHPSFNQEVVRLDDGSLECCWQGYRDGRFGIFTRRRGDGGWGPVELVSSDEELNVWDPTLVALGDGGVAYAWTTYGAAGYQTTVLVREPGTEPVLHTLGAGSAYALHPSLAVTPDGALWCSFDAVEIAAHAGSGTTRLRTRDEMARPRPTGVREDGRAVPGDLAPDVRSSVRVLRLARGSDAWEDTGPVGTSVHVAPAGLPRLAVAPDGSVAVSYRCLRRLPLMLYFWDVVVEWHTPGGWAGVTTFDGGDGPLEEPAFVGSPGGIVVAWQEDGRRDLGVAWTEGFGGEECLRRREHYGEAVWHSVHREGRVRLAPVPVPEGLEAPESPPIAAASRVEACAEARVEARPWAAHAGGPSHERYRAEVGEQSYLLYWGDLHRHSLISRCTAGDEPELDDFYRYSYDVCEYDFWAVTDHAENTSDYQWSAIQKLADVLHVPGRFVPFYGFEWTAASGHQNVIYDSSRRGAPIYSSTAEGTRTPSQLWEKLRGDAAFPSLTIPHHPGSAMVPFDWSYRDEDQLRLVEVFQACRGNYEGDGCFRQYSDGTLLGTFMSDGLREGHRFGLIASSDHGNGASYVGAYAEDLSRPSVFAALHGRRTIAATTRDIVVDFRLNDAFMGSEAVPSAMAAITGYARAYSDLARVDLVRNGDVARTWEPELSLEPGWIAVPLRVEWSVGESARSDWSGQLVIDGGEVLDTRFWSPQIVDVDHDRVAWHAQTRNFRSQYGAQRGGVELTLLGRREAVVQVSTATVSGTATLGAIAATARLELGRGESGALALQRGTGGLRSLGTSELRVSFSEPVHAPSWYYLRVTLEDGEMAWSSPIWVAPPD